jgi:hypothetical protein
MSTTLNTPTTSAPEPTPLYRAGIFATLTLFAVYGLWGYGIWDPWEVSVADLARTLADGAKREGPVNLTLRLVGAGFQAFGTREWAGRLPMALAGVGVLLITYPWVRRFSDTTSALYAAIVLGTTPFFLFHSREMLGSTPAFLASALVMLGASALALPPAHEAAAQMPRGRFAIALAVGIALGATTGGALLAVAPPLLATACVAWLVPNPAMDAPTRLGRNLVTFLALVALAGVAWSLLSHRAAADIWVGAAPTEAPLATYERGISELFHAFAPWSAVLPVAVASLLRTDDASARELPLRLVCVVWAALAYAAQAIFLSSYGNAAFPAPVALAVAAALWLRDRERDPRAFWPELTVVLLMAALIIRDYAVYPASPLEGLSIDAKPPEVFNPKRAWMLCIGGFGAAMVAACAAVPEARTFDPRAPYRSMGDMWRKGGGYRGWLVLLAGLVVLTLVMGTFAFVAPRVVGLSALQVRIWRVALAVPFGAALLIAAGQWAYARAPQLAGERMFPVLLSALLIGAYTSQRFMPELGTHMSPRVVFDTYNRMAKPNEPLAQYRVQGRAAAYYAKGEVVDVSSEAELGEFFTKGGRRWAIVAAEQLADVDSVYRRRSGKHLFVASMQNAKLTLVSTDPVEGSRDLNPLAKAVVRDVPKLQTTLNAEFEEGFELVGYNVELPHPDGAVRGKPFYVTWVWRAKRSNLPSMQVFVHVDGPNERINGDHDPVDGKYPVRLWTEGDVILDRQKFSVPATAPVGTYGLFVGMFRGDTRSKITGPLSDGDNRAKAGSIRVQ